MHWISLFEGNFRRLLAITDADQIVNEYARRIATKPLAVLFWHGL